MLPTGTAEGYHKVGETAVDVALNCSVDEGVAVVKEGEDFAILLEEVDDLAVEPGEGLVTLVLTGVVDGSAVEDVTAAIAGGVVGDAFFVGETHDADGEESLGLVGRELLEVDEVGEHAREVGILIEGLLEESAEVGDSVGNTLHKVRFLLEVAAEAIGAEDLEDAEEDEVAESAMEAIGVDGLIFLDSIDVFVDELEAERVGEISLSLPEERSDVVVERTAATALEVDEPRLSVLNHDVARLEVAVHESEGVGLHELVGEGIEVVLEATLFKFEPGSLEEAVLEIVEVPHNRTAVEGWDGEALGEVETLSAGELEVGEAANGFDE